MKYVIFSTDDQSPFAVQAFNSHVANAETKGHILPCVGSYKGETEWSWICREDDFKNVVIPTGAIQNQESVLEVSECNKQYAVLVYRDGTREGVGSLKSVDREEALRHDAWTYRPDIDTYWITVKGNPDTVPPQEGWLSAEKKATLQRAIAMLDTHPEPLGQAIAANIRRQFFPN